MEMLANTVNGRKDKNDVILQELVNARNLKQALSHCEKRLRKGEGKNSKLIINRARILLELPDEARQQQGRREILAFLERKPPTTDKEILILVNDLKESDAVLVNNAYVAASWERAVGERPDDEQLVRLWFRAKFFARDYRGAQKAAMVYSKNFPKRRQPFFWVILSSYLVSTAKCTSGRETQFYRDMAHRLLSKAAADVPQEDLTADIKSIDLENSNIDGSKGSSNPPRTLHNSNDLRLLVRVFKSQGRYQEALDILNDPRTGLKSSIGANSWDLVLEKLDLQRQCEMWEEQWNFCHNLLADALPAEATYSEKHGPLGYGHFGDDWKVWDAIVTACQKIKTSKNLSATKNIIHAHVNQSKRSRNARLALIQLHSDESVSFNADRVDNPFLLSCLDYFDAYGKSSVVFKDLKLVEKLSLHGRASYLKSIREHAKAPILLPGIEAATKRSWLMAEINTLKQDYFLAVSLDIDISDKDLLDSFIGMCLDLYKCSLQIDERLPVGERHTGDDAAILAAMGCIHAFRNGENRALLRCVTVLEILLSHSKHNYDALVMIVRVYIYLGAAKKAMEHYAKLDIKNMQISPLSWIFFTRISTIHPHASKKTEHEIGKNRDTISSPFLLLENAITMAQRNTQNGWSGVAKYLDHESFPNLLDHLDLMKQLEDPLAGYSLICEYLRVCRFGHGRYNDQIRVELNLLDPESILDLRDCSPFPNYEASGQRRCDEYIQPGPKPSRNWLLSQILFLVIKNVMQGDFSHMVTPDFLAELSALSQKNLRGEMTHEERSLTIMLGNLLPITASMMIEYKQSKAELELIHEKLYQVIDNVKDNIARLTKIAEYRIHEPLHLTFVLIDSTEGGLGIPDWHYFHSIYNVFDESVFLLSWLEFIVKMNDEKHLIPDQDYLVDTATKFRVDVLKVFDDNHAIARSLKARLMERETAGTVQHFILGDSVEVDEVGIGIRDCLDGGVWFLNFCASLVDSWVDGVEGVEKTVFNQI